MEVQRQHKPQSCVFGSKLRSSGAEKTALFSCRPARIGGCHGSSVGNTTRLGTSPPSTWLPHDHREALLAGTVLITGGAGFIGSHVADQLLEAGYRVRALDELAPQVHGDSGRPEYLDPEVDLL